MGARRPDGWLDDCCYELFDQLGSNGLADDRSFVFVVCFECDKAFRRDDTGNWERDFS